MRKKKWEGEGDIPKEERERNITKGGDKYYTEESGEWKNEGGKIIS